MPQPRHACHLARAGCLAWSRRGHATTNACPWPETAGLRHSQPQYLVVASLRGHVRRGSLPIETARRHKSVLSAGLLECCLFSYAPVKASHGPPLTPLSQAFSPLQSSAARTFVPLKFEEQVDAELLRSCTEPQLPQYAETSMPSIWPRKLTRPPQHIQQFGVRLLRPAVQCRPVLPTRWAQRRSPPVRIAFSYSSKQTFACYTRLLQLMVPAVSALGDPAPLR